MMPPPTMTTRARSGSSATDDILQQVCEVGIGERLTSPLVPFHAPAPEVEVQRAGSRLDEAPERPAVAAAECLKPNPGEVGTAGRSEVLLGPGLGHLGRESALGRGVAELEA